MEKQTRPRWGEWWPEAASLTSLALLFVFFVSVSWRKWPDPLIDFGRELYLPWRISQGALLYRDLEGHYGPLSQYLNSILFSVFGPGLIILVAANLVIFTAISALIYLLCRRAWGRAAAFSAVAVFISVFGFSQLVGVSNYNYASPYAHEVTHGILASLGLTAVLVRWIAKPSPRLSFCAGMLYGLCFVLKPEFVLAGAIVGLAALILRWRFNSLPPFPAMVAACVGVVLPTMVFTGWFALHVPLPMAFSFATQAWFRVAAAGPSGNVSGLQGGFSGLDKAGNHLAEHLVAVLIACLLLGGLLGLGWLIKKTSHHSLGRLALTLASLALAWLSWSGLNWPEVGRCLLGLIAIYIATHAVLIFFRKIPTENISREIPRILLSLLGASLMARMALNGRIYHYGFYQAAIAGSVLPAILVGELPQWLRLSPRQRVHILLPIAALLLPGMVRLAQNSQSFLRSKTVAIGEGVDRFYTFPRNIEPTGEIVAAMSTWLQRAGKTDSLLVLPEGIMINYLTRMRSPLPYYFYRSTSPQLVTELEARPPQRVLLISRNLSEYGVARYGDDPGGGQEIMRWLSENYHQIAHTGGNPLDNRQRGAVVFKRNDAP